MTDIIPVVGSEKCSELGPCAMLANFFGLPGSPLKADANKEYHRILLGAGKQYRKINYCPFCGSKLKLAATKKQIFN